MHIMITYEITFRRVGVPSATAALRVADDERSVIAGGRTAVERASM